MLACIAWACIAPIVSTSLAIGSTLVMPWAFALGLRGTWGAGACALDWHGRVLPSWPGLLSWLPLLGSSGLGAWSRCGVRSVRLSCSWVVWLSWCRVRLRCSLSTPLSLCLERLLELLSFWTGVVGAVNRLLDGRRLRLLRERFSSFLREVLSLCGRFCAGLLDGLRDGR